MIHSKHTTTGLFVLLCLGSLQAQETTSAAGGAATGSGGSSSYTVGQVVYSTHTGTNGSVAEGVQQPYEISTTVGMEVSAIHLEFTAWPNPTEHALTLSVDSYSKKALVYELYDMQGKLSARKPVVHHRTTIGMQGLPAGTYLLNILDHNALIKTFKIIKK